MLTLANRKSAIFSMANKVWKNKRERNKKNILDGNSKL